MTITTNKLTDIITEEFIETHKELDNPDALFQAVREQDSSITREEFDEYIQALSACMEDTADELNEEKLEAVAGGSLAVAAFVVTCVGVGLAATTIAYQAGKVAKKAVTKAKSSGKKK